VNILGRPTVSRDVVQGKLLPVLNASSLFINSMFDELWDASLLFAVDPVVTVAQSYKETGGGRFGGLAKPSMHNPCGLKLDEDQQKLVPGVTDSSPDKTLTHAIFPNWTVGALAHVQHLRAYSGAYLPDDSVIFSPRYKYVKQINKPVDTVEGLSGRWAYPGVTYGPEVVAIARKLGYTG
jgi:hypothetical protein